MKKPTFDIVMVFEAGFSWEEAEKIVRANAKEHGIEGEDLEKLLDRSRKPAEKLPFIRIYEGDFIEPLVFEVNGIPMHIYQYLKEQKLTPEEADEVLHSYCDRMNYEKWKREKIFHEWIVWNLSDEDIEEKIKSYYNGSFRQ